MVIHYRRVISHYSWLKLGEDFGRLEKSAYRKDRNRWYGRGISCYCRKDAKTIVLPSSSNNFCRRWIKFKHVQMLNRWDAVNFSS